VTIALYPGSFDPVTNGHLDIVKRSAGIFDKVIIGVYDRPEKHLMFSTAERASLFRREVKGMRNVEVRPYTDLTVDYARKIGARVIVRGLRMASDFELEFEISMMNKKLAPEIEMVCFITSQDYLFVKSSTIKEIARLGGDLSGLIAPHVYAALRKKMGVA
jgi:pantetheine-phosphate adenylyltransferase